MFTSRIGYWKIKTFHYLKTKPFAAGLWLCVIVASMVTIFVFRVRIGLELKGLYYSPSTVWLKFFAYGAVPIIFAAFGDHYAAEAMKGQSRKRVVRLFFWTGGILAAWMALHVEAKTENEHTHEVTDLTEKINAVQRQNTDILSRLVRAPADPTTAEAQRHEAILTLLRHEWILSHKSVSPGLLAGTEQPPSDWVNQRLKELGEDWSLEDKSKPADHSERLGDDLENLTLEALNTETLSTIREIRHSSTVWDQRIIRIRAAVADGIRFYGRDPVTHYPVAMDLDKAKAEREKGEQQIAAIGVDARKNTRSSMVRLCALRTEITTHRLQSWEYGNPYQDGHVRELCSKIKSIDYGSDDMSVLAINVAELQKQLDLILQSY